MGHTQAVKQILKQNNTDVDKGRFSDELIPFSIASVKGHYAIMVEQIKFNQTKNINMLRGWRTDKWVVQVLSSLATSKANKESVLEVNTTGMKIYDLLQIQL